MHGKRRKYTTHQFQSIFIFFLCSCILDAKLFLHWRDIVRTIALSTASLVARKRQCSVGCRGHVCKYSKLWGVPGANALLAFYVLPYLYIVTFLHSLPRHGAWKVGPVSQCVRHVCVCVCVCLCVALHLRICLKVRNFALERCALCVALRLNQCYSSANRFEGWSPPVPLAQPKINPGSTVVFN